MIEQKSPAELAAEANSEDTRRSVRRVKRDPTGPTEARGLGLLLPGNGLGRLQPSHPGLASAERHDCCLPHRSGAGDRGRLRRFSFPSV